jgi:hypothetical protein
LPKNPEGVGLIEIDARMGAAQEQIVEAIRGLAAH